MAKLEVLFDGQRAHSLNVDAEHIGFKCELGELHAQWAFSFRLVHSRNGT